MSAPLDLRDGESFARTATWDQASGYSGRAHIRHWMMREYVATGLPLAYAWRALGDNPQLGVPWLVQIGPQIGTASRWGTFVTQLATVLAERMFQDPRIAQVELPQLTAKPVLWRATVGELTGQLEALEKAAPGQVPGAAPTSGPANCQELLPIWRTIVATFDAATSSLATGRDMVGTQLVYSHWAQLWPQECSVALVRDYRDTRPSTCPPEKHMIVELNQQGVLDIMPMIDWALVTQPGAATVTDALGSIHDVRAPATRPGCAPSLLPGAWFAPAVQTPRRHQTVRRVRL